MEWKNKKKGEGVTLRHITARILRPSLSIQLPSQFSFFMEWAWAPRMTSTILCGHHPVPQATCAVRPHEGINYPEQLSPLTPFPAVSKGTASDHLLLRSLSACPQDFSPRAVASVLLFYARLVFSFLEQVFLLHFVLLICICIPVICNHKSSLIFSFPYVSVAQL